jgi:hypothetical protein
MGLARGGGAGGFGAWVGRAFGKCAAHGAVGVLAEQPADTGAQAVLGADGVADEAQRRRLVVGQFELGDVGEDLPQRLDVAEEGQEQGADPRLERGRMGARGSGGHAVMPAGVGAAGPGGVRRGLEGGCDRHWLVI